MSLRQMTFTKSELACNVVAHGMHIQLIIQVIEHVLSMHIACNPMGEVSVVSGYRIAGNFHMVQIFAVSWIDRLARK